MYLQAVDKRLFNGSRAALSLPVPQSAAYITGTIQSGEGFGARSAYCRWRLISGPEWTLLEGASKGHTQSAAAEAVDGRHEFAHPVDAHYSCTSLVGWPQLLVTVWQTDDLDRHEIGERAFEQGREGEPKRERTEKKAETQRILSLALSFPLVSFCSWLRDSPCPPCPWRPPVRGRLLEA